MFTVQELAKTAGVTRRTLHYYDRIGLLKPSRIGDNGYRYYGEDAALRLQQILLYRELDLPLEEIKEILGRRDFDILRALENHRKEIDKRIARMERLKMTVDDTILYLKGKKDMSQKQFFQALSDEQQAEYEQEAKQTYDPEIVKQSYKKYNAYTPAEKQHIADEGNAVYADLLNAMPQGAASADAQAAVDRWRRHMDYFWTPAPEQLLGLAEMYNTDARFKANFDRLDPNLAAFMLEAVKIFVERIR